MIRGIGTDIVELERFKRIDLDRLINRMLTKKEQSFLPTHHEHRLRFVAGRFAAKEAISKAWGTGIGAKFSFRDVDIIPNPLGKPEVQMGAALQAQVDHPQSLHIHLSISHSDHYAIAMAIIEEIA